MSSSKYLLLACVVVVIAIMNLRSPREEAELFSALFRGDLDFVQRVGSTPNGIVLLKNQDRWGNTATHWAAKGGNPTILKYLLDKGLDASLLNSAGTSALHWSAFSGNRVVMQELLQAGISVNQVNAYGETALHWAVEWSNESAVTALLDNHANPAIQDVNGDSPLHRISADCDQEPSCHEIVRLLVKAGAPVTLRNNHGRTPLAHFPPQGPKAQPSGHR